MYLGAVSLGDARIVLHHCQIRVTKQALQREYVSTVAKIRDGERMSETMWMYVRDASALTDALGQLAEHMPIHLSRGIWAADQKQAVFWLGSVEPRQDALLQRFGRALAKVDNAFLGTLALDLDVIVAEIDLAKSDVAQFLSADTTVQE